MAVKSIISELRRPKSARLAHRHAIAQQQQQEEEEDQSSGRRFMTRRSTFESIPTILLPENDRGPVQAMNLDRGDGDGRHLVPLQPVSQEDSYESNQPSAHQQSSAYAPQLQSQPLPYIDLVNQPTLGHLEEQLSRYTAQGPPPLLKGSSKIPITTSTSHFQRVFMMEKQRKEFLENEGKSFKKLRNRIRSYGR